MSDNVRLFQESVVPLFQANCFSCHGPDKQDGGIRFDIRRRALNGGDNGEVIVPGDSGKSELIRRLVSDDESIRMPFGEPRLSESEINAVRQWIDGGANWPDELAGKDETLPWAFLPIPEPSKIVTHPTDQSPIDSFITSRFQQSGIAPAPEAPNPVIVRRLSLDLIGLPPDLDSMVSADSDTAPDYLERIVDRLLGSPQFGERWGKHWLDVARFGESDGYENDNPRPHAWRYRDWVIRAINDDLPFDEFTIRQLAGDLLEKSTANDRIATAFHRNTLHNSAGGADQEEFRTKAVKDRTATTGTIWMGLTLNCCECHSHKYDPISHREYYQLYAFFNRADHHAEGDMPTLRAADRVTRVHKRGNFLEEGAEVVPSVPAVLPELKPRAKVADRLDLARWLVSPEHPLTARVCVNQVWQHLFGIGLVATPENFGRRGLPPTHPELLDWLAFHFRSTSGWSRKSLIRQIVSSSAYRRSSTFDGELPEADPDNRLLWRQNRIRLEAEIIRDLALSVSGLLDATTYGPSIQPPLPKGLKDFSELKNERFQETKGNPFRRGVYVHMQRTFPYPLFASFDSPDGNQCAMVRDRSTTPLQSLMLLNDPAMDECARAFGNRLARATQDDRGRIRYAFQLCLFRSPSEIEYSIMFDLLDRQRIESSDEVEAWHGLARTMLNLDESITRE